MARSIMIQGTMSNVGKSLIVGALCRIFSQDGYKTAPFKSQNMALNSFITDDGLEMGRAQVMQAEAANTPICVDMNPILLKPSNDTHSQVIVNGKIRGNMSAREYFKRKKEFIPDIMRAYNRLDKNYDIIVIEGAGSPAEINLKENDIVNMGMAKLAKSPVILVGDIDRGGVFAQLAGTVMLLEDDERDIIKGLIINKFRGDKTILQSGLNQLESLVGKAVTGVVPYIDCDIDDEDSLSERFERKENTGLIDIAVIKLKRISNFTDFNVFQRIDGVSLRYADKAEKIGNPDMLIIPGTKNTIDDMLWLRECGIEAKIKQYASRGGIVFGICGGYQMLGESITDNDGAEHKGTFRGMELLPVRTVFSGKTEKTTARVKSIFTNIQGDLSALRGKEFYGYEIHMGESYITDNSPYMTDIGGVSKGNVYGSYVHGIFDSTQTAEGIIKAVMDKKGIDGSKMKSFDADAYKQRQYDILADGVRNNINMDMIYKILNDGI